MKAHDSFDPVWETSHMDTQVAKSMYRYSGAVTLGAFHSATLIKALPIPRDLLRRTSRYIHEGMSVLTSQQIRSWCST